MCTAENLVFKTFYGFHRGVDTLSVTTLCNIYLSLNRQKHLSLLSILTATVSLRSTILFSYWLFVRDYVSITCTGLQENKIDYPEELISVYVSPYIKGINVHMGLTV